MSFYSVPGVYPTVNDQSQFSRPSGSTPTGIVVISAKGQIGVPVLCTSPAEYINKFGAPDASFSLATYAAFHALGGDAGMNGGQNVRGTSQLWVVRAAHADATYGGLVFSQQFGNLVSAELTNPAAYGFAVDESFVIYPLAGPGAYAMDELAVFIDQLNPTKHTFRVQVFDQSNLNVPLETFVVSKRHQRDGFGRPQYLEDAINSYSKYIQVLDNPAITADPIAPISSWTAPTPFADGDDGSAVTDGDIIQAWNLLSNPDIYPLKLMVNGGFASPAVQQHMVALAENRIDALPLLDVPSADQEATDAVTYRNQTININSWQAAMFCPDWEYYDPRLGTTLMVPASGAAARNAAFVDATFDIWWPFAGQDRGAIQDALKLRHNYSYGEIGLMYDACLNVIIKDNAAGIYINGNRTLQVDASALQSTHIARLVKFLLIEGSKVLQQLKFEFNNPRIRAKAVSLIDSIALPVKRREGLYDYRIVCDESNNSPDSIDRNELYVDFYIQPVRDVEFIAYRINVMRTGVDLSALN